MSTKSSKKPTMRSEMMRIRKKYDLTQERFGELFEIKRTNVVAMEANDNEPTACWSVAFAYVDEYGIELLEQRLQDRLKNR